MRDACPDQLLGLTKASYLLRASSLKLHREMLNSFVCFDRVVPIRKQHLLGDRHFTSIEQNKGKKPNLIFDFCKIFEQLQNSYTTYLQKGGKRSDIDCL